MTTEIKRAVNSKKRNYNLIKENNTAEAVHSTTPASELVAPLFGVVNATMKNK